MKARNLLCTGIFVLIFVAVMPLDAQKAQKDSAAASDDYAALESFLPGDDDAKILLMIQCTVCHGAAATKERIAARAGGDITFWTMLVWRMNATWNAKIPEEDVNDIVAYLTKYFGPSSKFAATNKRNSKTKK